MSAAARAITRAESMGISLTLDGTAVHLSGTYAPPDDLLDQLRANKGEVIHLLARRAGLAPPTAPPPSPEPEPPAEDDEREVMAAHYADPGGGENHSPLSDDALTAGLLRSARLRPTRWQGGAAIPSPGAECSGCGGRRWWSNAFAWHCTACHPIPLGLHDTQEKTT